MPHARVSYKWPLARGVDGKIHLIDAETVHISETKKSMCGAPTGLWARTSKASVRDMCPQCVNGMNAMEALKK